MILVNGLNENKEAQGLVSGMIFVPLGCAQLYWNTLEVTFLVVYSMPGFNCEKIQQ